jgi:hypothetical protein
VWSVGGVMTNSCGYLWNMKCGVLVEWWYLVSMMSNEYEVLTEWWLACGWITGGMMTFGWSISGIVTDFWSIGGVVAFICFWWNFDIMCVEWWSCDVCNVGGMMTYVWTIGGVIACTCGVV